MDRKVALVVAATEYMAYMESSFKTAEEYFTHKGMIQTYSLESEIELMKEIVILSKDEDWRFHTVGSIIGKIMKKSGNKYNPNEIKRFLDEIGIRI
jgi:Asp-tRNA(Asn)/Glu-tRNA(Gln) amidotransferase B subunit